MGLWDRVRRIWTRVEIGETRLGGAIQETEDHRVEASVVGSRLGGESQLRDAARIDARNTEQAIEVLRARAGEAEDFPPAHTGDDLKKDVERHADDLERWNREDKNSGS